MANSPRLPDEPAVDALGETEAGGRELTWRERLQQQPSLWDFAEWPIIAEGQVAAERRGTFRRNKRIITQVLDGLRLQDAAAANGVSRGRVSQMLTRCLGGKEEEPPALTRALVPRHVVSPHQRKAKLPTLKAPSGYACAFTKLLDDNPVIKAGLEDFIEARLRDSRKAQRLTPAALYGKFERLLGLHLAAQDAYPFTDTTDKPAYHSVRRYLKRRTEELGRERQARRQRARAPTGPGDALFRVQRATQIDEHCIDVGTSVELLLHEQLIPLNLARPTLLVAVDRDTTCNLGYYLAATRHANQQDVLALFEHCLRPGPLPVLSTPGLEYPPGAGFPGALEDGYPISFGTVELDNAMVHRAESVTDFLCKQCGATLSYGPPASPTRRSRIEAVFRYLTQVFTHRPAATTGKHPADPERVSRKNRKQPSPITFQALEEAIGVALATHNARPLEHLHGASPLELYQDQCERHFVRYVPALFHREWRPLVGHEFRPLRGDSSQGRSPYVYFYYARYHGPGLIRGRKGEAVRLEFDWRDIRTLRAYTRNGADLGEIWAPSTWQQRPHGITTRKAIHAFVKRENRRFSDLFAAYFDMLYEDKEDPSKVLEIERIDRESWRAVGGAAVVQGDAPASVREEPGASTSSVTPPSPTRSTRVRWSAARANHRRAR